MKRLVAIYCFFIFPILGLGQAQFAAVDKKMNAIPESETISTTLIANYINSNFNTENDKIRAVFYWTTSNIQYDIDNMYAINFNETTEDKINKTLKSKKGVCINYAEIFNDIAKKVGIKSFVIEGYTKQNGKTDYVAHAWCGAKIDNKWFVFDPTWGSGGILKNKFVPKINSDYCKADPNKIISSHIPFDYLWQFSNYPVTNQEFYLNKTQINKSKVYFDFEKEIADLDKISDLEKLKQSLVRIEKNGIKNGLIFDRVAFKKSQIENFAVQDFNNIVNLYNQSILEFNAFIDFRNKQFKPSKSDKEIDEMIQNPLTKIKKCQDLLNNLRQINEPNLSQVNTIKSSISATLDQIKEQEKFVKDYLSKGKLGRKTMFTKISWFGIPLN
jgi:Transglutaminase-like superfamily